MIESLKSGLWLTPARLKTYPILLLVMLGCGIAGLIATAHDGRDWFGRPLGPDFSEIWAAGQEVRAGQAEQVYDIEAHKEAQAKFFGASPDFYLWSYPPYFLGVAAFLALFPYLAALLIWQAVTLLFYLAAVFAILKPAGTTWTQALIPTLAFPAVFVNLTHGHNGFLTAALLTGGLLSLKARPLLDHPAFKWNHLKTDKMIEFHKVRASDSPKTAYTFGSDALAGALFACLAYKPQFAAMIPIALLAGGYWRCLLSGAVTLSLLTLATFAAFGPGVWERFPGGIRAAKSLVLEHGGAGFEKMQSLFAAARLLGASIHEAYLLQATAILLLTGAIAWLWHSCADFRLKGAGLLTAALLTTPYSFDYDMLLLGPALAFTISYGLRNGFAPYEKSLFACVWIAPLLARPLATATHIPIGAFLMSLFFLAILQRARQGSAVSPRPDLATDSQIGTATGVRPLEREDTIKMPRIA